MRNYNSKDVDMLVASNVVLENFKKHKATLVSRRKVWEDPFEDNLKQQIDEALEVLGVNTRAPQTASTQELLALQEEALSDLATFRIIVEVDFQDQLDKLKQMMDLLGDNRFYKDVTKANQESLVQLLTAFKNNMTEELKGELTQAGMEAALIDRISALRDPISEANIRQEALKSTQPNETAVNVETLNNIYKQVIGICKIAPRLLPDVPSAEADFSFRRILNRLN